MGFVNKIDSTIFYQHSLQWYLYNKMK